MCAVRRTLPMVAALSLGLVAAPALGEVTVDGFALQVHVPTYAGDRFFASPDAAVNGRFTPSVKLGFDYAHLPLRVVDSGSGEEIPSGRLVRDQLYLDLDVSLALFDRLEVDVALPFVAWQSGDALPGTEPVRGGQIGDVRLGARLALLGRTGEAFALGLQADLFVPTGPRRDFAGDGFVRGHPRLIASGLLGQRWVYSAAVGVMLRRHDDLGIGEIGTALTYSAAAGVLLFSQRLQVGPELYGSTNFAGGASPLEAMLGAKACLPAGLVAGVGVGAGLTRAPGAAAVRALATLAWEPGRQCGVTDFDGDGVADDRDRCPHVRGEGPDGCPAPLDRDSDGVADAVDACPAEAGVANFDPRLNGCPPDRDGDGVPDSRDACPAVAGSVNGCPADSDGDGVVDADDACPGEPGDVGRRGCPVDSDHDGVPDTEDACPNVAGEKSADPKVHGCPPPDGDGDGVPDASDACPGKPGPVSDDPKKNGCPAVAVLRQDQIVILQQVQFQSGKAVLERGSEKVLQGVAAILRDHPEIARVSIEGHTDDVGRPAANLALSKARAAAVRQWLVSKARVAPRRLTWEGFGQERPLTTNATPEGRQANRRVEFHIVQP